LITGSLNVTQNVTASNILVTNLYVQNITASTEFITGSSQFGSSLSNKHMFTGSVEMTGSGLNVAGNLGIGTYSPSYKLDVNGTSGFRNDMYVFSTYSTYWYNGTTYFQATNTSNVGILKMTNNSSPISLQPNGGNVGIGTTSPQSLLHLQSAASTTLLRIDNTATNNDAAILLTDNNSPTTEGLKITYDSSVGDSYFNNIYTTSTNAFHFQKGDFGSGTELLTIKNDGNVGVNTTTPNAKLQIGGTTTGLLTVGTLTNDWGGVVAIGTTNGNGIILSKVNAANDSNRVLTLMRDDSNGASIAGYKPAGTSADIGFLIRANTDSYFNGGLENQEACSVLLTICLAA